MTSLVQTAPPTPRARRRRSLLPKEHGAYAQLAFPGLCALALGGVSAAGVALAVAVAIAFVLHEPALILIGRRGRRAQRELAPRAKVRLLGLGPLALALAATALALAPASGRWALAAPLVGATFIGLLIWRDRERTALGEASTALVLASAAVPIGVWSGLPLAAAAALAGVWGVSFAAAVLAVRGVIARHKRHGSPAAALAGMLAPALSLGLAVLALVLNWAWRSQAAALLPVIAVALLTGTVAFHPRRLRVLGFLLAGAAAISSAALLIVGV